REAVIIHGHADGGSRRVLQRQAVGLGDEDEGGDVAQGGQRERRRDVGGNAAADVVVEDDYAGCARGLGVLRLGQERHADGVVRAGDGCGGRRGGGQGQRRVT